MSDFILNMPFNSNFNLSFMVNMGASRWFYGEEKADKNFFNEDFKDEIPKNEIFEINSMIFNILKHKKEILTKFKCYFEEKSNSLFLILNKTLSFSEFTKEIMMNLFTFCEKVGIDTINFMVAKKNPQYIRIIQDLLVVGFKPNEKMKEVSIEDDCYNVLEIKVISNEPIEEFYF